MSTRAILVHELVSGNPRVVMTHSISEVEYVPGSAPPPGAPAPAPSPFLVPAPATPAAPTAATPPDPKLEKAGASTGTSIIHLAFVYPESFGKFAVRETQAEVMAALNA